MAKFTDAKGREWLLSVTVGAIKAVRKALDIDLADLTEATGERLATDVVLLVEVLWLLCEAQAKERGVSPEDFGNSLAGDPIEAATEALLAGIADFFPRQRRLLLQTANAKTRAARQKAEELSLAKLASPDLEAQLMQAMEVRLEAELRSALNRLSSPTNSQESSASTPTTKP